MEELTPASARRQQGRRLETTWEYEGIFWLRRSGKRSVADANAAQRERAERLVVVELGVEDLLRCDKIEPKAVYNNTLQACIGNPGKANRLRAQRGRSVWEDPSGPLNCIQRRASADKTCRLFRASALFGTPRQTSPVHFVSTSNVSASQCRQPPPLVEK